MYLFELINKAIKWMSHRYYQSMIRGETTTLSLKGHISITCPEKIKVGRFCCINDGVQIHAGGGITLGDNVTISMGAKLITRSYDTSNWIAQCNKIEPEKNHYEKPIVLGDHTWICAGATILPGVTISAKGVVVGSGTVLAHDVTENYVLVAGAPARIIKRYNEGTI